MHDALSLPLDVEASLKATDRQSAEGAIKIWEDLNRYRAVIQATRPDVIVECGSWYGGSALWFVGVGVDVVTVDVDARNICRAAIDHPAITIVTGNSADPDVAAQVADLVAGRRVMVVLDSDHSPEHVEREIDLYASLVSPGCYLVVEDGIQQWMTNFDGRGPLEAIESRLTGRPEWVRDLLVESMYPITMHPAGWWRHA